MNWAVMRDTIASVIPQIIAVEPTNVLWKGTFQENSIVVNTRVVLATDSVVTLGRDEERLQDDQVNPLGDQAINRCGQRKFTLSVAILCQNQGTANSARVLADQLRIRMWRRTVREQLNESGMAVQDILGTTHKDFIESGRMVSWANVDFLVGAAENDTDDTEGTGSWIGEALISGQVKQGSTEDSYATVILLDNPTVWYRLADAGQGAGPRDSSGKGHDGAWTNASAISTAASLIDRDHGNSASFADNATAKFNVGGAALTLQTRFSLEFWLKPTAFGTDYNSCGAGAGSFLVEGLTSGDVIAGTNGDVTKMQIPNFYTLNQVHHVVYTYDGVTGSIYRNGILIQSQPQSTPTYTTLTELGGALEGNWHGTFDEWAFYNGASLSPTQVLAHYNAGHTTTIETITLDVDERS